MSRPRRDPRLARLDGVDLARVLGPVLLDLLRLSQEHQAERYEAALTTWENALGSTEELHDRSVALAKDAAGLEAIRNFATENQYRAAALLRFGEAAVRNSAFDQSRWRWAARAYGCAIRTFISETEQALAIPAQVQRLLEKISSVHFRGFTVLHSMGESHLGTAKRPDVLLAPRLHSLARAEDVRKELVERNYEYDALQQRSAELRQKVVAEGMLQRANELIEEGPPSLRGTVAAYEAALREASEEDRWVRMRPTLSRLEDELVSTRERHARLGAEFWEKAAARLGTERSTNSPDR